MGPRVVFVAFLTLVLLAGGAWAAAAPSLDIGAPSSGQELPPGFNLTVRGNLSGTPDAQVFVWVFDDDGTTYGGVCRFEAVNVSSGTYSVTFGSDLLTKPIGFTVVAQGLGADGKYSDGARTGDGKLPGTYDRNLLCDDNKGIVGSALSEQRGTSILGIFTANSVRPGSDDGKVFQSVQFYVRSDAPTPSPLPFPTPSASAAPPPTNVSLNNTSNVSGNNTQAAPPPAETPTPSPPPASAAPVLIISTPAPTPSPSPTPAPPRPSPSATPRQPGFEALVAAIALAAAAGFARRRA